MDSLVAFAKRHTAMTAIAAIVSLWLVHKKIKALHVAKRLSQARRQKADLLAAQTKLVR